MIRELRSIAGLAIVAIVASACGAGTTTSVAPTGTSAPPGSGAPSVAPGATASGEQVTISIESWRSEDAAQWNDQIIPLFEASHPNINLEFNPTAPGEYDAALTSRLQAGSAGDIITCRGFDNTLALFEAGHLVPLNDLPGMENFSETARVAWSTDDGSTTSCVPMGSYPAGFIYNKDIFDELSLTPPETWPEFIEVMDAIKANGKYQVLALGTHDQWEAGDVVFSGIGPTFWEGEKGRLGLIDGSKKFTDQEFVDAFEALQSMNAYLPEGHEAQTYSDSQNMFTLGQAAIYPGGSWELANFNAQAQFTMGYFPPPRKDASQTTCYVQNQPGQGSGLNAKSAHPDEAKEFLTWLSTSEFNTVMANTLVGAFPMADVDVTIEDPVAQQFLESTQECENTIRLSYQVLSRGEPNLTNEVFRVAAAVLGGSMEPAQAAQELQTGLDSWYTPGE